VIVSTGDKDMAQLVERTRDPGQHHDRHGAGRRGVVDKFGIPPARIIDLLALMGDKVDNIPGLPASARKPPSAC
jgi:DNA polymerase-1